MVGLEHVWVMTLPNEALFVALILIVCEFLPVNSMINCVLYGLGKRVKPGRKYERQEVKNDKCHEDFNELDTEDFKPCRWLHTCQLEQEGEKE